MIGWDNTGWSPSDSEKGINTPCYHHERSHWSVDVDRMILKGLSITSREYCNSKPIDTPVA